MPWTSSAPTRPLSAARDGGETVALVLDILAPRTPYFPPGQLRQGLGGNEATLVLWWRALRNRGVRARVYLAGQARGRPITDWGSLQQYAAAPGPKPDVVIGWRDAAPLASAPARALTMLYTGDRATPNLGVLDRGCDLVFVGSPAAFDRYSGQLRPRRGWLVDSCGHALPGTGQVPRRRWRCVHASAPYRGLAPLLQIWPSIRRSLPGAELLVLGGYQLWGYHEQEAREMALREVPALADPPPGVRYLGPVPRTRYARALASAEVMLYPTNYEEMCCIAALEAAALGTVPVLSAAGALTARVQHGRTGLLIDGDIAQPGVRARFAEQAVRLLSDAPRLHMMSANARAAATHQTTDRVIGRLLEAISR